MCSSCVGHTGSCACLSIDAIGLPLRYGPLPLIFLFFLLVCGGDSRGVRLSRITRCES